MTAPDFRALARRAQAMRQEFASATGDLDRIEATGYSGSGLVSAVADGTGRLRGVHIDPSLLGPPEPVDARTLADHVLQACNSALDAATELRAQQLGTVSDGLRDMLESMRSAVDGWEPGAARPAGPGAGRVVPKQPDRPPGGIRRQRQD